MAKKFETYFRTIGKYRRHRMGTKTDYVPVGGANGPEFRQITQPKFEVLDKPTRCTDESVAERLRNEKFFGRYFIECDAKGRPAGQTATEPEGSENTIPADPAGVTDANSAVQYFASHVKDFDPNSVIDKSGRLNYNLIKQVAEANEIVFPNYG